LLYLEFEIKIRYSHKKPEAKIKTKKSDTKPNEKIFKLSANVNELCVIG